MLRTIRGKMIVFIGLPVFAVTASVFPEFREKPLASGFDFNGLAEFERRLGEKE